ncbi:MAG: hypothetical protein ABSE99_18760 [Terracidiphilus sp.]|jgi:hypothetical protein
MPSWVKNLWNDPVLSKVIGGLITGGILALCAELVPSIWGIRFTLKYCVPLWLVIALCLVVFILSILLAPRSSLKTDGISLQLKHMGTSAPDPDPNYKIDFPLKCWWTFRNDSESAIDVTFWEFVGRSVKVKSQAVGILQVQMIQQWLPVDHGVAHVAVLPGQLFKGWIAPDEAQYTAAQIRSHFGHLGTLTLKINGKLMEFEL